MANDIESFVAATEPESAPSSQPDSAVARWYSGEDESSRVGLSVKAAQDITPDAATRVNKLQAKTGLPEDLIHRNLDEIEKINNASDFDPAKFMKSSPTVAKWMAESPTNSAIVKDNLSGVENIEHTVQDYGLMQTMYRALASGTSSAEAGIAKIPSVISNSMLLPYNATVKYISKRPDLQFSFPTANPISDYFDAQASGVSVPEQRESIVGTANLGGIAKKALDLNFSGVMREIDKGNFTRAGRILATQFAANLPQQAAIMAATFYGYANPALVGMGATQAAGVMSEGQAKDADPTALTVDALLQGTIESGFESLGTFGLLKHWENAIANQYGKEVSGRIIKDFTKTLLHTAAGEGNEEFLTQIAQDYSDYITGINPDAMKGTFKRALDAGLIGATSGAAVTGPGAFMAGVSRGAQMRQTHLAREFYENLGKAVEESKLNETSPETTATLVSRMVQDSPINSVYIAPEALEEKITSLGQDPLKVIQSIGFGKEYSEAKAAGTQMQIPLADWTAKSGELYQSMADDIKFQPEGMSVNDTAKLKEQVKAAEESAKAAEEAKTPEQTSSEQVGANVIEQLKAAGFDEGIAQTYAKLYETAFGTLGQRAGIDPAKLFEQYGLQIRRPDIQPTGTPGSTEMAQETPESPIPKDLPVIEDKAKEGEPYAVFDYNWQLSKETPTLAYFKVFGDPSKITEMTKSEKQPSGNGWGSDITLDTIKASGIPIKGKTARAVGEPSLESLENKLMQSEPVQPVFFSAIEKAIADKMPAKAPGSDILAMLKNTPGIKQEEMDWIGLSELLKNKKSVTKEELSEFVKANQVQIQEVTKGEKDRSTKDILGGEPRLVTDPSEVEEISSDTMDPKTDKGLLVYPNEHYIMAKKNGEYELEIVDSSYVSKDLPELEKKLADFIKQEAPASDDTAFSSYTLPGSENYKEMLLTLPREKGSESFQSSHFAEPNILAHIRMNDRTDAKGNKILHIEEIQSDWHQRGRQQGYGNDSSLEKVIAEAVKIDDLDDALVAIQEKINQDNGGMASVFWTGHNEELWTHDPSTRTGLLREYLDVEEMGGKGGAVPDAPFKKTWHELALKRMLRYAVENGYDKITWTTGEQQSERYDLSKQVDYVSVSKSGPTRFDIDAVSGGNSVVNKNDVSLADLPGLIGKDLASKIEAQTEDYKEYSGLDLKVGGEGMKGFYDQMIPSFLNKYAKKWGAKVGETTLELPDPETTEKLPSPEEINEGGYKVHSLDITPAMKESVMGGQPLFQGERGLIRFGQDRQFNIDLLKSADLSTFLHETGHFYLEVLGDLASNPNATPEIKTDLATIYKYLGVESRDQIEREHHEKFARSFEAYLMEGKAPTSALRAAFARFKSWLTAIYRQVKGLNVELTPEVRDVFDRLIASEDEIAAARAENEMTPLFSDPKSVGMTDTQAESYTKAVLESKTEAEDELTSQLMKEANRKQKQWWLNEREKVEKEVSEKVDQDPEQIALAVLQKGTLPNGNELPENLKNLKLSKKAIVEQFKDYPIKNLPKPHVYTAEGGLHPDVAATLFGFKSGSELLFALETAPKRETLINQQVDAQMQARHGDLMKNPFQMYEAAKKAIHNDKQAHLLRTELQHLASNNLPALKGVIRNVTRSIPTVEAVRNQAEAIIADKRVRDIQPNLYQRAEIKAGRDAVNSVLKGDFDTAFEAKRRELLNHELYRAATNAQETTEKTVDYMSKFNKDTVRAKLGNAGEEYLDQIDSIMERFDFRKGVSLRAIDRKKAMVNWVNEQRAQGNDPQISDAVLNEAYQQNYKDVQMSVLVGVRDSVRSIEHLASLKNKLMANEAQRNLEEAKESIVSSIKAFHDLTPEPIEYAPTFKNNMMTKVQSFAASHTRMEFLFKFLDGNKPQGKAWETFFKPMADAENNENRMMKEVVENLNGIFGEYTRKERAGWFLNRIWIPEIQNHMTKANLMTLALNMGNEYNREAVMQGRGWTDQQLQAMLKHLDARDIKTVNAVWKYIETFKEPSFALERDLNGLEPEAVDGTPYKIKAGTLEGGYYPIVFDKTLPWKAPELQAQATLRDMFEGNWGVAMTKHNHLKERTATGGKPILLEMTGLTQHLSDVVHDLSYRRAVIDSYKMMNQPEIRDAITVAAGSEMYKQLNPWLKAIAGERRNAPANPVEGIFGRARSGATVVNLGLKVTSGLVQTLGYLNTVKEVGANYAIKGLRDVYLKPWKFNEKWDFCSQRSGMMRDRIENWDRDIRDAMKKLSVTSDPSLLSETLRDMGLQNTAENIEVAKSKTSDMQKSFFAFVGYMDLAMSVPTWLAAYRKGMDGKIENVNAGDEKAVSAYADSIVRQTQSAGGIKDSAAIQRGSEAFKLFTMFYSQLSLQFNQFQDIHNEFRLNHNKPALIGALSLLWFIPAVLEDLVRGRPPDGDDEDKWKKWILRKEFLYPFQTIILGRDLASSADRYLQTGQADYQGSPIFDAGASLVRTGAIPLKLVTGDEITRSDIRSAFNTAGYVFRLPTKQMWMTAQYLYDWMTGDESPTTPVHGIFHALVGGKTP